MVTRRRFGAAFVRRLPFLCFVALRQVDKKEAGWVPQAILSVREEKYLCICWQSNCVSSGRPARDMVAILTESRLSK